MRSVLAGLGVALALARPLASQEPAPKDTVRLPEIVVVGQPSELPAVPGAVQVITARALERWHVLSVNEALRRVPGLVARDEEGLGLRPNIGVRGLSPTRSTKVLLLEDGVPVTFAPYGDNASYYHPPVSRFARVEVLKGSGQILFGPQTIGGVINYVTPPVPLTPTASLLIAPGTRGYMNVQGRAGASRGQGGVLLSVDHLQSDGSRANVGSRLDDATLKATLALGAAHGLTLRGNVFRERSNVTYSGLTESEWAADPRQNPFLNDSMLLDRWGASATHRVQLGLAALTTTLYTSAVDRDWWRQSSNSAERPNDASDPACGGMTNLTTTCGNQGRLRRYGLWGVEPRFQAVVGLGRALATVDAGVRAHFERQDRRQVNGATPTARTATAGDPNSGQTEDNHRANQAYAAFVQGRVAAGRFTVAPGVRVEHIRYERVNALPDPDVSGTTRLTQVIPGLGATYSSGEALTVFAGVHRGFAPPRTEDVIRNDGGTVDLAAELSWNSEIGVRAHPAPGVAFEVTAFRLDFENQIVPASVAGGTGATLTSAGRTLHQGLEVAVRIDVAALRGRAGGPFVDASWTWLPTARFDSERYVFVGTGGTDVVGKVYQDQDAGGTRNRISVTGNRLPYAPEHSLTLGAGYAAGDVFDVRAELVTVGRQFGDPLNTAVTVPDGQQGVLPGFAIVNLAATWTFLPARTAAFVTVKNAADKLYLADRTRGLMPGAPRTVQAGLRHRL